jgi:hypothetical protein
MRGPKGRLRPRRSPVLGRVLRLSAGAAISVVGPCVVPRAREAPIQGHSPVKHEGCNRTDQQASDQAHIELAMHKEGLPTRHAARCSSPASPCVALSGLLHAQPTHYSDHCLRVPSRAGSQRVDLASVEFSSNRGGGHVIAVTNNVEEERPQSLSPYVSLRFVETRM